MSLPVSVLKPLTLADIHAVARDDATVEALDPKNPNPQVQRILKSADWVRTAIGEIETRQEPIAYYGINTGFGDNAGRATFRHSQDAERLSRNLLLSHSVGTGDPLPEEVVRTALLIRVNSLAKGYSGVRLEVINTLIAMLNRRVFPVVPSQGSLGASGDLAPLAHMVIPISAPLPGEEPDRPGATGYCFWQGQIVTGREAMAAAGIPQIRLGAKEGVALINGTAISLALGLLALHDAKALIRTSELALALTIEAVRGFRDPFLPPINVIRSKWQAQAAAHILNHLEGSTLARGNVDVDLSSTEGPPQDPYCIRCAPAVLGAAYHALDHVETALLGELDATTDNPLIFTGSDPGASDYLPRHIKVISGGNFHGAPVGYVMDYLGLVITDLTSIAERRIFMLTDPKLNRGLPPFLIAEPPAEAGLNSGLMIAQYTAASLVSENKSLAHPASVDSIPSSANREDHVSMSTIAARKAAQIVANARHVGALELLCAAQALRLRQEISPADRPGRGSREALG
ncbi:MAG TPA: aromatic amino acid ammonia-lyase, partial [Aggregatilineales bacterium]|nr:aromatic amino acid ammonia-lyase [Aggregatilineales bacterium]